MSKKVEAKSSRVDRWVQKIDLDIVFARNTTERFYRQAIHDLTRLHNDLALFTDATDATDATDVDEQRLLHYINGFSQTCRAWDQNIDTLKSLLDAFAFHMKGIKSLGMKGVTCIQAADTIQMKSGHSKSAPNTRAQSRRDVYSDGIDKASSAMIVNCTEDGVTNIDNSIDNTIDASSALSANSTDIKVFNCNMSIYGIMSENSAAPCVLSGKSGIPCLLSTTSTTSILNKNCSTSDVQIRKSATCDAPGRSSAILAAANRHSETRAAANRHSETRAAANRHSATRTAPSRAIKTPAPNPGPKSESDVTRAINKVVGSLNLKRSSSVFTTVEDLFKAKQEFPNSEIPTPNINNTDAMYGNQAALVAQHEVGAEVASLDSDIVPNQPISQDSMDKANVLIDAVVVDEIIRQQQREHNRGILLSMGSRLPLLLPMDTDRPWHLSNTANTVVPHGTYRTQIHAPPKNKRKWFLK